MKQKLISLLTLLLCVCSGAWADDTLFNVDFTDETTEQIKGSSSSNEFIQKTYDGYTMYFGTKNKDTGVIDITNSTGLQFTGNNYSDYNCLAIPLTLTANNKVTATITLASAGKVKYNWVSGALPAAPSAGSGSTYTTGSTTNTLEYTPTSAGNYVLYLGRSGSSDGKVIKSIVITQESAVDETAPTFTTSPSDGATNVAIDAAVTLTADEDISAVGGSIAGTIQVGDATPSDITFSLEGRVLSYSHANFEYNTEYTITLNASQVKDGSDNDNAETSFTFTTRTASVDCNVTFSLEGTGASGVLPANAVVESGNSITLPAKNFTLYKEGYTMTGWNDGTNDVAFGEEYPISGDVEFKPVFTSNSGVTLANRNTAVTVKFEFQRGEGAPEISWGEGSGSHFWVGQANVNGKTIDVKADINVTASGKMANGSWADWIQINNTTEITIPSAEGAVVSARVYGEGNTSTVGGNTCDSYASYINTYNVTSTASTVQFIANSGTTSAYYKYIQVVLPINLAAESDRTWDFTSSSEFTDAASADKSYTTETLVNNLIIGNGVQLIKKTGDAENKIQRLKLNNQGSASGYYVKIKVTANSKVTVRAVGGSSRNITFRENEVGGTELATLSCTNSSIEEKVLNDTGAGEKTICIYNPNSGNITLYSITVAESVSAAPTSVTVSPDSPSASIGASVTLTATADGVPTPTITWYQCDDEEKAKPVELTTGTTYQPSTAAEGTFYFYATAENSEGGPVESDVVTLTVTDPNIHVDGNAYYIAVGDIPVKDQQVICSDITMTYQTNSGGGYNVAVEDNNVSNVNSNFVASVAGNDNSNNWGTFFEPTVNGTLSVGVIINKNKTFTITNVTSFSYVGKNGAGTSVDETVVGNTITTANEDAAKLYIVATIDVVAGNKYKFSVAGSKMGFYGFEFTPTITVGVPAYKEYATFNCDKNLDFTGVTDVYAYTAKISGSTVTLTKVDGKVPANEGLLIRGASLGASADVPVAASANEVDNDFVAVTAAGGVNLTSGYVLATVDGVQGFYPANTTSGTLVSKGKAYLPTGAGARLTMVFDDKEGGELTGISLNKREATATDRFFNLSGQRVAQPSKGLYIVNGKKVIVK